MRSPPLSHIYLWSGWIDKLNAPRVETRGHPHTLPEVFLRITHISETILSMLTKLCPNVPWVILFQSYSLVSYLFIKQDQMILTCNSAVASLMLSWFLRGCIPEQWCNDWHNKLVFDVLWKACTIEEKSEGWLALNQDNVSKWSYMSTHILVSMR